MIAKTTLLYEAGCYGEFVFRMLNLQEMQSKDRYSATDFTPTFTNKYLGSHHLTEEGDIEGHVTKITYSDKHVDLINRNKWTKVKGHLEEQANKTFPNVSNGRLYTIAVNMCNLLSNRNFKQMQKKSNYNLQMDSLLGDKSNWTSAFEELYKILGIPGNKSYITNCYDIFKKSQEKIIFWSVKDEIYYGNQLGKKYFEEYGDEIHLIYLDILYKKLGGEKWQTKANS